MEVYVVTFFKNIVGVFSTLEEAQEAIDKAKVRYPKSMASPWKIHPMKLNSLEI